MIMLEGTLATWNYRTSSKDS